MVGSSVGVLLGIGVSVTVGGGVLLGITVYVGYGVYVGATVADDLHAVSRIANSKTDSSFFISNSPLYSPA